MTPADVVWWKVRRGRVVVRPLTADARRFLGAERRMDYMDARLALWHYRNARLNAAIVQLDDGPDGPPHVPDATKGRGRARYVNTEGTNA